MDHDQVQVQAIQLDEESLRRPDFRGGRAVVLEDGQAWYFPLPVVQLAPAWLPSGQVATDAATQFGPAFDRLLDDLQEAETIGDDAAALLGIAADLLGRNYDLTRDQARSLLRYGLGPDGPGDAMDSIRGIATGQAPKA